MDRHDYAFPFRIDANSGQAAQTNYEAHVEQMIRQVLLTSPGERADLPDFGCGIRKLLFAPHSEALDASTQIIVQQALNKWLGTQITVQKVKVLSPEETGDEAQLLVQINYSVIETRTDKQIVILVF